MPNFWWLDTMSIHFLGVYLCLAKNLSLPWKVDNPRYHNYFLKDFWRSWNSWKHVVSRTLAQEGGPIKNRGCTDVICFLLFFAFLGGWGVVGYYGFKNGDPTRLIYPSDSSGAICGSSDKLANRPNLLFFDLTKCLRAEAVALGCLTKQVILY